MALTKIGASVPSKTSKTNEAALAKILAAITSKNAEVIAELSSVKKDKPLAKKSLTALAAQEKIMKARAAVFKDLEKSKKRGELHTNPSKLERTLKEINEDVARTNGIAGAVLGNREAEYLVKLKVVKDGLVSSLPKGVHPASIGLDATIKKFAAVNKKSGWTKFEELCPKLLEKVSAQVEDIERQKEITTLKMSAEFRIVNHKKRDPLVDAAIKNGKTTPAQVRKALETLLEDQLKPSKAAWAGHLKLGAGGSYSLKSSGAFEGMKIHVTMSTDSWTADADGKVNVRDRTVDQIFSDLLEVQDWKQMHATLEVTRDARNYPHVYLFAGVLGNDTRWETARDLLKRDGSWTGRAQAALEGALEKVRRDVKAGIKTAKDKHGLI